MQICVQNKYRRTKQSTLTFSFFPFRFGFFDFHIFYGQINLVFTKKKKKKTKKHEDFFFKKATILNNLC